MSDIKFSVVEAAMQLHMNQYGIKKLPWICNKAHGIFQNMSLITNQELTKEFEVLDVSGGYASACLGADNMALLEAFSKNLSAGYVTDEVYSSERSKFLHKLFGPYGQWNDHFPYQEYHVSGRNSGSEGMELALRLVYEYRFDFRKLRHRIGHEDRNIILCFEGAWHGWTEGVRHLINRRHYRIGLPENDKTSPYGFEIHFVPFGDQSYIASYINKHAEKISAVIIEPIQGDAGILIPPEGYLREISNICKRENILLVADEVLTFAKTGSFFAMVDSQGPIPTDITVIGKSIGMGIFSQSIVIARRELNTRPTGAVCTSDLRPLTCSVMGAGIEMIQNQKLCEKSGELGIKLRKLLNNEIVNKYPDLYTEVRGKGFLNGIEIKKNITPHIMQLRDDLIRSGLYIEFMAGAGKRSNGLPYVPPAMRIAPPLITTSNQIEEIVERLGVGTSRFIDKKLYS